MSWVPCVCDPMTALDMARKETFLKRMFRGSERMLPTPEAAVISAGESGTCSVLDIETISEIENPGTANGLDQEEIMMYFDTPFPSRKTIEACDDLAEDIGRGCARIIKAYESEKFVGWVILGVSND